MLQLTPGAFTEEKEKMRLRKHIVSYRLRLHPTYGDVFLDADSIPGRGLGRSRAGW